MVFSIIVTEQQEPASYRAEADAEGAGKFFHKCSLGAPRAPTQRQAFSFCGTKGECKQGVRSNDPSVQTS